MTSDKPDHSQASQPIENRLRQALHTRAEQVQPSSEAFFTINRRISRREAASPWHPRSLWEKRAQLRLQPSTVLSLVLLVALTAVTTVLLTRENSDPEIITTGTGSTEGTGGSPSTPAPDKPELPVPESHEPTEVPPPVSTTPENPSGEIRIDTHQPPDSTTEPPTTTEATTTTTPQPGAAQLLQVRPLQVASRGFPQVYAEHRVDSEYITKIQVNSDQDYFKTTRLPALDSDGQQWIEVTNSEGDTGWVQSLTVSVQPHESSTIDYSADLSAAAQRLVDFVKTANESELDAETKRAIARALPLSSRGIYLALANQAGTAYGYHLFTPDLVRNHLLDAAAETDNHMLQRLAKTLNCLSQAQAQPPAAEPGTAETTSATAAESDATDAPTPPAAPAAVATPAPPALQPPGAFHILSHAVLTDGAGCNLLVYFDFLQATPEIIAISIHEFAS